MAASARPRMIDIAANLTDGMFKGMYNGKQAHPGDILAVLSRAWEAGVERIIITGGSLEESKEALALADTDARLFCTVGVHPTRCTEFEGSGDAEGHLQQLLDLAREGAARGKVVAIGECGLDYDRLHFCPVDVQKRFFERQFDLAHATGLPMFLHMRAAADDFCEIVRRNEQRFAAGVVHSFTDSAADRDAILAINKLFIGINGCSLKTEENLSVMEGVPLERMMIETDSPYCEVRPTHAGFRHVATAWPSRKKEKQDPAFPVKGRTEPCQIRQVLEVVAARRGLQEIAHVAATLHQTTCRVFFPQDLDSIAATVLADAGSQ